MIVYFFYFLFLLFIASLQDLKRREIDNWLNLLIFFSGFLFVLIKSFSYDEYSYVINMAFVSFFMLFLAYVFYYARIFSAGDCKLLFSLSPIFISVSFFDSFYNSLIFIAILFFIGSLWGFFWIFSTFISNFRNIKKEFIKFLNKNKIFIFLFLFIFLLGFLFKSFFIFSLIYLFLFINYIVGVFSEKFLFTKKIKTENLRVGDWLASDVRLGNKIIKSSFDGLERNEVALLKKKLNFVKIKEGVPFIPAFFFAFIFYWFRGIIMEYVLSILGFLFLLFL